MPEHTPGPWRAYGTWVSAKDDGSGPLVADFERDADAELGAAAPEMLEALQAVARLHPSCAIRLTSITHSDVCAQVQSAIAKATGGMNA